MLKGEAGGGSEGEAGREGGSLRVRQGGEGMAEGEAGREGGLRMRCV